MVEQRQRYRRRVHCTLSLVTSLLATVAAVAVLFFPCAEAEDMNCLYKYTEHLLHNPSCSPYPGGIMELECTVEVPLNASGISIGWFLDCMELTNDSHITVLSQDQYTDTIRRIRSQLTISDITDDYAGEYTCNILGDEEYIPSDLFTLRDSSYYEVDGPLAPCNDGNVFANIEEAPQKCADITENRTIPMSLSCAEPAATTSHDTPMTSTPVVQTTPSPSLSISLPPSTSSLLHIFPHTSTSSLPHIFPHTTTLPSPTPNVPMVTDPQEDPSSLPDDPRAIWLYVVVAVAAVFFMITVILAIICVGMCLRRSQSATLKQQVHSKQFTGNGMLDNTAYQGDVDSTFPNGTLTSSQPLRVSNPSDYNTLGIGDYEVVDLPGGNYQRLQRPTLTPGMMPRFVASREGSTFSPTATMASMFPHSAMLSDPTKSNGTNVTGILPPPLPSTAPPRNMVKLSNSPEASGTFDSAFHTGKTEMCSPLERDRIDSTSVLLPQEQKVSDTMPTDFESLYIPVGQQRNSPSSPRINHPLQNVPETGASFPEPRNPKPFPTSSYKSIPGKDLKNKQVGAQYEKPICSPKKPGHRTATFPVHSPPISPPPSGNHSRHGATVHVLSAQDRARDCSNRGTNSPEHHQQFSISGPIYHTLEHSNDVCVKQNGSTTDTELKDSSPPVPVFPVFESADFAVGSDCSATNTLTPGFPVCSADFAETSTGELSSGSGAVPQSKTQPRRVSKDCSSDFTGDSDYPQIDNTTDYTGGSSTTAYPESDWTAGTSTGDRGTFTGNSTTFTFNGTSLSHCSSSTSSSHTPSPMSNGNCSVIAGYTAGSSHTVPLSGSSAVANLGEATSHTISAPRNHYKKLDPSTMEPYLKYTRLNVGKLTVV